MCKFSCGIFGTASELGFGNRVIERKPLGDSFSVIRQFGVKLWRTVPFQLEWARYMSLLRLPLARLRELLKESPAEAKLARGAVCWLIFRRGLAKLRGLLPGGGGGQKFGGAL